MLRVFRHPPTAAAIALATAEGLLLGCASAPTGAPLPASREETSIRVEDDDARVSITRLSKDQVLKVLGPQGRRLSESATILEVEVVPVVSHARLSEKSFRLRLPTGEMVDPLEPKWVLVAMDLPGDAAPSGTGTGETAWPLVDEPDNVETAMLELALVSILVVAIGVKAVIDSSKAKSRLRPRAAAWEKVALPRTVERGHTDRLLVVYWPRYGRVPAGIPLPIEVQFELSRCTWRAEVVIPAD